MLGKRARLDAHTVLASGGINAALGTRDPEDSWEQHFADTLREGYFLGHPRLVEMMARESPDAVLELAAWGCEFARTEDGRLDQRFFGAHRWRRTCYAGDFTGRAILRTVAAKAAELSTRDRVALANYTEVALGRGGPARRRVPRHHPPLQGVHLREAAAHVPAVRRVADARHLARADRGRTDRALHDEWDRRRPRDARDKTCRASTPPASASADCMSPTNRTSLGATPIAAAQARSCATLG